MLNYVLKNRDPLFASPPQRGRIIFSVEPFPLLIGEGRGEV
jgi:hypothetical protein